jgi:predicted RNA-binding Zn-ribbon protein involved in translation (DUF1610 family)
MLCQFHQEEGENVSTGDEGTRTYGAVKCPNCGEVNLSNARHCSSCGYALSGSFSQKKAKRSTATVKVPQKKDAKELVSSAFYLALYIGWSLFSIFLTGYAYGFLASFGLVAVFASAILFLHLFAPVAVGLRFVEKKAYGTVVFVCWLILSFFNATGILAVVSGLGMLGALAVTIFAWIVIVLVYALINNMFFDFPFGGKQPVKP